MVVMAAMVAHQMVLVVMAVMVAMLFQVVNQVKAVWAVIQDRLDLTIWARENLLRNSCPCLSIHHLVSIPLDQSAFPKHLEFFCLNHRI